MSRAERVPDLATAASHRPVPPARSQSDAADHLHSPTLPVRITVPSPLNPHLQVMGDHQGLHQTARVFQDPPESQ